MKIRRVAGVDLRDGEYDICSYSQTIDRYWGRDERAFDFALRAFDVPSFSAYAADTTSVTVESDITAAERLHVTPDRRDGDGFTPISEQETEHDALADDALGKVIIDALARAV